MKVPHYNQYYGRKSDGACISSCDAGMKNAFETVSKTLNTPLKVDFTKSFKANLEAISNELWLRDEVMGMMDKAIETQMELFTEVV